MVAVDVRQERKKNVQSARLTRLAGDQGEIRKNIDKNPLSLSPKPQEERERSMG